jgi:putative hydrolase of the HAD superfamily
VPIAPGARAADAPFADVDTVCLDLDGTLVDALAGWHAGFAAVWPSLLEVAPALARLGKSRLVYDDAIRRYMSEAHARAGDGEWSDDFVRGAFRRLVAEHVGGHDRAVDAIADRYIHLSAERARLFSDTEPALGSLASHVRLAVISNGLGRDQRRKLAHLGLAERFDAVVISEEVDLRKPDPAIFAHTLDAVGSRRESAIYVGDNPAHDIAGAHAAGMRGVWIDRGDGLFPSTEDADARITRLDELSALLGLS